MLQMFEGLVNGSHNPLVTDEIIHLNLNLKKINYDHV